MNKLKLIVLLILVCLIFAACSPENKNPADNSNDWKDAVSNENVNGEEVTEPPYWDILGEKDFGGDTFTIIDAVNDPSWHYNMALEITGEPINDGLYNRDRFIEEKYNVQIKYIQMVGAGVGCKSIENAVAAGMLEYDLAIASIFGNNFNVISLRGVLYNMIDIPNLSLESPWWSKMIYENMKYDNKIYYTGGDIYLPTFSQGADVMMFNKNLFQDRGIRDNLYEMVFDGKWTLDVFERLIKDTDTDLNNDGKLHASDDFFGIVYPNNTEYMSGFFSGAGAKFSTTTADGELIVDLNTPTNLMKLDKLAGMLKKINYNNQDDPIMKTFKENRSLFLVHCMLSPQRMLRDMESDYGILPMPKWDEAQESYVSLMNGWGGGYVGIPANTDIEKSGFLTEAMAYAGYEMLREPVYEITFAAKAARDEESERIIDIIIETAYMDINHIYNFGDTQDMILQTILNKKDFVSSYEKKEAVIEKDIAKYISSISPE